MSDWTMEYIKSGKGLPPLKNNHSEEDNVKKENRINYMSDVRARMKQNQFKIPTSLNFLSDWYPLVPWNQATQLWRISVEEVLCIYNIETLLDLPFGQAIGIAKNSFEKRLEKAQAIIEKERK